jgi:hypothetical protein
MSTTTLNTKPCCVPNCLRLTERYYHPLCWMHFLEATCAVNKVVWDMGITDLNRLSLPEKREYAKKVLEATNPYYL